MKRKQLLLALGIVVVFTIAYDFYETPEEKYLNHIKNISKGQTLEGPEKSVFRDVVMTMNPETGELDGQNVKSYFENKRFGRIDGEDFEWTQIDTEIAGRVRSIMMDPNDGNKLWAGAVTGGLWYNPDFRNNADWVPVSDNWETLSIGCITSDPVNTQTYYVGTGESFTSVNIYRESSSVGAGIYKTTDGGSTWSLMESTEGFEYVNDIVVRNEEGVSVVYAAVASGTYQGANFGSGPSDGLFRSTDGGMTWTQVLPNIEGSSVPYAVSDIEEAPNGELYIGTMRNLVLEGGGRILHSTDGVTWALDTDGYAESIIEEGSNNFGLTILPGRVRLSSGDGVIYAALTAGWLNSFNQIRDAGFLTRLISKRDGSWAGFDGPSQSWASIPWHALGIKADPNNSNRLVIGALDLHAVSDATNPSDLSWIRASDWTAMYHFSDYTKSLFYGGTEQSLSDSIISHFVHADVHDIKFINGSSDEILISNDGGVHYSEDFSKSYEIPTGERLDDYAGFRHINNSFSTTQYYTVALHPEKGNNEVLAGSQDNSTHTSEDGMITYNHMIGGGDGAYCFFDSDDPSLRITSSQMSFYNIFIDGETPNAYRLGGGSFINPAVYDDRSNLLYSNMAVDGGFEVLSPGLSGRFLDTLAILNLNKYLKKNDQGLDTLSFIKLGTVSTAAFSAFKISPHHDPFNATMVLGNQLGDVFVARGLPFSPETTKIDNDQLPFGYVSSVDIGDTSNDILVTFSNYGVASVWYTNNGGQDWQNLERNLPDVPVRDGIFNPLDDQQIMIATEVGVWGLENILDPSAEWVSYNDGFPNVRVDAIQARGSDSTIVAATHGRGLFLGKFSQGPIIAEPLALADNSSQHIYPNPTVGPLGFNFNVARADIYSLGGVLVKRIQNPGEGIDISKLNTGMYVLVTTDSDGQKSRFKLLKE